MTVQSGPAPDLPVLPSQPTEPAPPVRPPPRLARVAEGIALGATLAVGLGLRAWGLDWGLPDRFDLNPDEYWVFHTAAQITWRNWDPHFYSYSGLTFHLFALIRAAILAVTPTAAEGTVLLLSRSVNVLLGTATIGLLFLLTRRLAPPGPAALIAAALLAVMPLHVWDSHVATTDVGLVFWTLAVILAAVRAYDRPSGRAFALASLLVGVAVGVKFNGALSSIAIAVAGILAVRERRLAAGQLVRFGALGAVCALIALGAVSPYTFVRWKQTLLAFNYEYQHVHTLDYGFNLWAPGWQYHRYLYQIGAAFPFSFGLAAYAAVVAGLVYLVLHLRPIHLIPLSFAMVYFVVTGSWAFVPIRYYLPMEPLLLVPPALLFAAGLAAPGATRRWATQAALLLVLGYTTAFTVSTTARFAHETRVLSRPWLESRVAEGAKVMLVGSTWYLPYVKGNRQHIMYLDRYTLMLQEIAARRPDYVVATSLHYDRAYRQHDANEAMWDSLRMGTLPYRRVQTFRGRYFHQGLYRRLDPMFEGYFVSPTIEVYRRQD